MKCQSLNFIITHVSDNISIGHNNNIFHLVKLIEADRREEAKGKEKEWRKEER